MSQTIEKRTVAGLELTADWNSAEARHRETIYSAVNIWGDLLPGDLADRLVGKAAGDALELELTPALGAPQHRAAKVERLSWAQFFGGRIKPRLGRFYPQGMLSGVEGVFSSSKKPFRCVAVSDSGFTADLNHPLAGRDIGLTVEVKEPSLPVTMASADCVDWLERLLTGPGMQARVGGRPSDFLDSSALSRPDQDDDALFYQEPRLVGHLDSRASGQISRLYGSLFDRRARVLDLMSSFQSHLPRDQEPAGVVGLGLNAQEMEANPQVGRTVVHDLNKEPRLPFNEASFAAIICTASVEYLVRPREVFSECRRVLEPGGVLAMTWSNRWFPPKAIELWSELHEFERLGLVLDLFLASGAWQDLASLSLRGWPRPRDDRHYPQYKLADPVFAAWGRKPA